MIKTLNFYSGLISIVVLIIGFFLTLQTFGFELVDKVEDVTADYAQYKKWSIQDRRDTKKETFKLLNENNKSTEEIKDLFKIHAIHHRYSKESDEKNTAAIRELSDNVLKLTGLIKEVASSGTGFIKIVKGEK